MKSVIPFLFLVACIGEKPEDSTGDTFATDDTDALTRFNTGEGPAGWVTIENTCAPDDGPAVEFKIGLLDEGCGSDWATTASLRIALDGGWTGLGVGTYTAWGVWYDPDGDGEWIEGATATITIDRVQGDLYGGSYRVETGADTIEGTFGALHCYGDPLCG